MAHGYPNGYTKNDIPFEAQIIRVADEYDAITSKRQYKTHIDISDTLDILISKTKKSTNDPKAKLTNIGKMNPKVVRVLLKVVVEDIEYEISCIYDYVEFLKNQIKRLETIKRWHEQMQGFNKQKDIDYYTKAINEYFEQGETLENYQTILNEYKTAFQIREEKIKSLYKELKKVKKMRC